MQSNTRCIEFAGLLCLRGWHCCPKCTRTDISRQIETIGEILANKSRLSPNGPCDDLLGLNVLINLGRDGVDPPSPERWGRQSTGKAGTEKDDAGNRNIAPFLAGAVAGTVTLSRESLQQSCCPTPLFFYHYC